MTRLLLITWVAVALGSALGLTWAGRRAVSAHAEADRRQRQLILVANQAQELNSLGGTVQSLAEGSERSAGLAAKVGEVLAAVALPASALSSLTPASDVPLPGRDSRSAAKTRQATLTLSAVTLPQLGAFLEGWRRAEPGWAVVGIEVGPVSEGQAGTAGGDLPLRAVLVLESVFMDVQAPVGAPRR